MIILCLIEDLSCRLSLVAVSDLYCLLLRSSLHSHWVASLLWGLSHHVITYSKDLSGSYHYSINWNRCHLGLTRPQSQGLYLPHHKDFMCLITRTLYASSRGLYLHPLKSIKLLRGTHGIIHISRCDAHSRE